MIRPGEYIPTADQRIVVYGVPWAHYERHLAMRSEKSVPRISYLRGTLELMRPSRQHERITSWIGRLIEVFAEEYEIQLAPYRSWTLKRPEEAGAEPDECRRHLASIGTGAGDCRRPKCGHRHASALGIPRASEADAAACELLMLRFHESESEVCLSEMSSQSDADLPDVDERLVAPGSRYEIIDGTVVYVPPCDPPHGESHARLAALLNAHKHPDYRLALDMLTRTSRIDDIAPDASIFPRAPNPKTGRRQLEELAFEIASTQSLGNVAIKARKLSNRGVRRVFAIELDHARAFEWSSTLDDWSMLDLGAQIEDRALATPIPVAALVDDARADESIVTALRARDQEAARAEAKAQAVLIVLAARGLQPSADETAIISAERDPDRLERWLRGAIGCTDVTALLRR